MLPQPDTVLLLPQTSSILSGTIPTCPYRSPSCEEYIPFDCQTIQESAIETRYLAAELAGAELLQVPPLLLAPCRGLRRPCCGRLGGGAVRLGVPAALGLALHPLPAGNQGGSSAAAAASEALGLAGVSGEPARSRRGGSLGSGVSQGAALLLLLALAARGSGSIGGGCCWGWGGCSSR